MREVKILNTKCTVIVQPNGHLWVYIGNAVAGHIQFKRSATDDEIIEAAKYFLKRG